MKIMYKVMALDIGTKRIGVALSDYLLMLSNGHSCVQRQPEEQAIATILQIAKDNNVKKIVVGIPFNMDDYQESLKWAEDTIKRIYSASEFIPKPDIFFCDNICDYSCKECEYGAERICASSCTYDVQPERCDD